MDEAVINGLGETIAVLDWRDDVDGTRWAKVDDGTITALVNGEVLVKVQNPNTGKIRRFQMASVVDAFYSLGLSVERCNGIDGWLEMALAPGTAGRD